MTKSVLRDNLPWLYHTFQKLSGEITLNPVNNATFTILDQGNVTLILDIKNTGLQQWNLEDENITFGVYDAQGKFVAPLHPANMPARTGSQFMLNIDLLSHSLTINNKKVLVTVGYKRYASDKELSFAKVEFSYEAPRVNVDYNQAKESEGEPVVIPEEPQPEKVKRNIFQKTYNFVKSKYEDGTVAKAKNIFGAGANFVRSFY